jgi:hypothetical protein
MSPASSSCPNGVSPRLLREDDRRIRGPVVRARGQNPRALMKRRERPVPSFA